MPADGRVDPKGLHVAVSVRFMSLANFRTTRIERMHVLKREPVGKVSKLQLTQATTVWVRESCRLPEER